MSPEALDKIIIAIDPLSQTLLALSIVTLMFAIALGLKPENFAFLKTSPRLFWGGLFAQIVALPAMTIALAAIIGVGPSVALGMIVVAACPGGSVSNFMTYLAHGDVAYSVSLTAGSSIIAAFWTPFAIIFWSDIYPPTASLLETIEFSRAAFVTQTTIMLAAPLISGMTVAHLAPTFADRIRGPLAVAGGALMAGVIIYSVLDFIPLIRAAWMLVLIPVAIHNAAAFAMGAASGHLLGGNSAQRRSLTFEVGIQNAGLAVVLLLSQLAGLGGAAAVAASWGVWHFFSGGAMILLFRHLDRKAS